MSQIDFDSLQADHPEHEVAWTALRRWFANNWRKEYVELSVLLRALKVDRLELILAIQAMIERGMLSVAYRIKAPGGYLLKGEYPEPDLIPPELPDRDYSGNIRTAEGDIVSGYRWEITDAA